MDEKEFEEKQEQQGKTDSVQEEQAVESAQEEPVSAEDTTKDHEPEEEKTEDSMTDEEKEALEKAKAADHANDQRDKERLPQEVVDNVNKKSLLKRIGLGIVNAVKKVAYVALTPVRWVGDRVIELTMPKESRAKMYNEAIQNAYDEQKKKQEAATRENGHTIAKKMEILNNEKLTDHEKILELSKLCYDTKRTIYVKTQEGAFKFERSGDSVLISHANPMKRTLESQATYTLISIPESLKRMLSLNPILLLMLKNLLIKKISQIKNRSIRIFWKVIRKK